MQWGTAWEMWMYLGPEKRHHPEHVAARGLPLGTTGKGKYSKTRFDTKKKIYYTKKKPKRVKGEG